MNIDAKAREAAFRYLFPEAPLLEWEEHGSSYKDLVSVIASALLSARNEALEEAAKVADENAVPSAETTWGHGADYAATHIATAIRALKEGT